jgi:hypothetical protein
VYVSNNASDCTIIHILLIGIDIKVYLAVCCHEGQMNYNQEQPNNRLIIASSQDSGRSMESGGEWTGAGRMRTSGVEKTRRGVEAMEVVDGVSIKASSENIREKIATVAREGWAKIRAKLQGKGLKREGSSLIVEELNKGRKQEGLVSEELEGEWLEGGMEGMIEVEEMEESDKETSSVCSGESRKTRAGFEFLDEIPEDREDEELEEVRKPDRKRKRASSKDRMVLGMGGTRGWEWREREGREEKRWKREVMTVFVESDGTKVREKCVEKSLCQRPSG